jgi:hypothetical protein
MSVVLYWTLPAASIGPNRGGLSDYENAAPTNSFGVQMKWLVVVLAVGALTTALKAAFLWHRSGQVKIEFGWPTADIQTAAPEFKQMDLNAAVMSAAGRSAAINGLAGLWTAASIILAALALVITSLTAI